MDPIRPPGADTPATFGGSGWRVRTRSHAQDVASGEVWGHFGVSSEVAPLTDVLLTRPGPELDFDGDPEALLMLAPVQPQALAEQADRLATFYRDQGIRVHWCHPRQAAPPNLLFQRDLFFMTPQGAVLSRMAAPQRAGEERHTALALAEQGIPILHTIRGSGLLEGADALWLNDREVLVGVGHRTNSLGCDQLEEVLAEQGVQVHRTSVHPGVQHLLGMVNLVRTDLAVVHGGAADDDLLDNLRRRQIQALVLEPDRELTEGRSNNFVTLTPSRVVLPSNCPRTREILESHGVQTHEVDVSQYLYAAGGPGCVTGIVRRG